MWGTAWRAAAESSALWAMTAAVAIWSNGILCSFREVGLRATLGVSAYWSLSFAFAAIVSLRER